MTDMLSLNQPGRSSGRSFSVMEDRKLLKVNHPGISFPRKLREALGGVLYDSCSTKTKEKFLIEYYYNIPNLYT